MSTPSTSSLSHVTRWGILSTSNFAEKGFLPGLRRASNVSVVAVASRSLESAQAYAARNAIDTAYGSYEELLADPNIDVIYNPLPNHLHVEWTTRAVEAGKHVLCEKPFSMNAAEIETLRPLTSRKHIAEAFMVRHHPQWTEVKARIAAGDIGELTHAHIAFQYTNTDPKNIRNILEVGGGALYDIGCYAIVAARWFFDAEPVRALGVADRDPAFGTDRRFSGLLDMGAARAVNFTVSTQSVPHQRVHLFGTKGRFELTIPFNQPQTDSLTYLFHDGSSLAGLDTTPTVIPATDQYARLAEWFSNRVQHDQPDAASLNDAVNNMKVLDALFRSEKTGNFEAV